MFKYLSTIYFSNISNWPKMFENPNLWSTNVLILKKDHKKRLI